jgi:hypothetical protein
MSKPAIDGPITAEALKTEELSAIAFIRSCLPTISTWKACRVGTSRALIVPVVSAATITIQYSACPVALSAKRASGGTTKAVCERSNTFRFRKRSAITPANGLPIKTGRN